MILVILIMFFLCIYLVSKEEIREHYGNLRVANSTDEKRAIKYALKTICEKKGYKWVEMGDEFAFDCKHTESTCKNESVYETVLGNTPKYYEWRDQNSQDAKDARNNVINMTDNNKKLVLSTDIGFSSYIGSDVGNEKGICILGNEFFRKTCEENDLTYNIKDGSCVTNKDYCLKKVLPYCNGDCYQPPLSWLSETVLGTTLGRSLAAPNNYVTQALCPN